MNLKKILINCTAMLFIACFSSVVANAQTQEVKKECPNKDCKKGKDCPYKKKCDKKKCDKKDCKKGKDCPYNKECPNKDCKKGKDCPYKKKCDKKKCDKKKCDKKDCKKGKECPNKNKTCTKKNCKKCETGKCAKRDCKKPACQERQWKQKLAQYAHPKLGADISSLPQSEQAALKELIEASKLLDPIFNRQAYAKNPELMTKLKKDNTAIGQMRHAYAQIHRGPWDRQQHFKPFAVDFKRPEGAGFYPEDMSKEEFKAWISAHPKDKAAFEGLFTVIRRDGKNLIAVPYSQAFKEWLVPAAAHLNKAADLTNNKSLATFLRSRAKAFMSDDYYQSDKDWMDLNSAVEVTIGPYEVYEDSLFAYKAAFESFVTVTDPKASADLAKFKGLLPAMEKNLPLPKEMQTVRGGESPIRVVDLVFTSGDAKKSVQTIAFNLPNDERVRQEKGAKKVLLRNAIETKFENIMHPIADRIITADQMKHLDAKAFFNEVLFHELSHSLGPAFTIKDGKKVEIRIALESSYSAIEEAKADVMGAYNILYMIQSNEFPKEFREKLLLTYFAGLFRSVRFGISEAHGKGAAMQINKLFEMGAAYFDETEGKYHVNLDALEKGITRLTRELCILQHNGDKAAVDALLNKHGVISSHMEKALSKLEGIPVDIRPEFTLAK